MKKYLLSLFIICLLLVGCGNKDTDNKKESGKESKTKSQIEETVIYEKDDIKVIAKSINYDGYMGPSIKIYAENNSDKDVTVQTDYLIVNDLIVGNIFSMDVAAGKKANDEIFVMKEDLELSKIDTFKTIEFNLFIIDPTTWDTIDTKKGIKLETNAKDYVQKYEHNDNLVLDKNGIKIYYEKMDEDSFWGIDVYFYIENNSNKDITIQVEDTSANGFMMEPVFSEDIPAGKKVYSSMSFYDDDLEENDVSKIEEIETEFIVFDMDTYDDIFETGKIKIETK